MADRQVWKLHVNGVWKWRSYEDDLSDEEQDLLADLEEAGLFTIVLDTERTEPEQLEFDFPTVREWDDAFTYKSFGERLDKIEAMIASLAQSVAALQMFSR